MNAQEITAFVQQSLLGLASQVQPLLMRALHTQFAIDDNDRRKAFLWLQKHRKIETAELMQKMCECTEYDFADAVQRDTAEFLCSKSHAFLQLAIQFVQDHVQLNSKEYARLVQYLIDSRKKRGDKWPENKLARLLFNNCVLSFELLTSAEWNTFSFDNYGIYEMTIAPPADWAEQFTADQILHAARASVNRFYTIGRRSAAEAVLLDRVLEFMPRLQEDGTYYVLPSVNTEYPNEVWYWNALAGELRRSDVWEYAFRTHHVYPPWLLW